MAPLETADDVLATAAQLAGIDATNAVVVRAGSNMMYQLSGGIVARIRPEHTQDNAARQVEVAQWLIDSGLAAVRALNDVPQPPQQHPRRPRNTPPHCMSPGRGFPTMDLDRLLSPRLPRHRIALDLRNRRGSGSHTGWTRACPADGMSCVTAPRSVPPQYCDSILSTMRSTSS